MMTDAKRFKIQESRTVWVRSSNSGTRRPGSPQGSHRRFIRAFTLIELMISIALVVILILGVSQVFQYTTQAVGAGEAVTAAIRSSRSAQTAFDRDFSAMVGYGPGNNDSASLIISSRAVYAFRDAKDQASVGTIDATGTATGFPAPAFRDIDGDGISGKSSVNGEIIQPDNYNYRNHRLDTVSFFARGQFPRQTGNLGTFVDALTTQEAWVWYGHLWLPDNNGQYLMGTYPTGGAYPTPTTYPLLTSGALTFPGAGTSSSNPNNYFANQFVLGRQAILLKEKTVDNPSGSGLIYDNSGYSQRFIDRSNAYVVPPSYAAEIEPLSSSSLAPTSSLAATGTGDTTPWYLQDGRYDLAATTISAFRTKLASYNNQANLLATTFLPLWYDWMMDGNIAPDTTTRIFPPKAYTRFKCNPFLTKPMTAANMAQASPYFLGGCSQFIVEFAGDFLTQDNDQSHTTRVPGTHSRYGDVLGPAAGGVTTYVNPDQQLDFFINGNGVKQTIWYGMPRNTSGQSKTCARSPASLVAGNPPDNTNGDVVPMRDWLQLVYDSNGNPLLVLPDTFEKVGPAYQAQDYNANMTLLEAQQGYTCAWQGISNNPLFPNDAHPKIMMIRITMTLEDPTGRLPDGQTFQYIFPVAPSSTSK